MTTHKKNNSILKEKSNFERESHTRDKVNDMAIRSIENLSTNDLGETDLINCPVCNNYASLRLFKNVDKSMISLLHNKEDQNFAVCAKCSSVFEVNPNYVHQKEIGTFCMLTKEDLTILVKGNV